MIAFLDIESTGLEAGRNEILTCGLVLSDLKLNVKDKKELKFRPLNRHYWSEEAEEVHGISWRKSQTFPDKRHSLKSLLSSVPVNTHFVCHALPKSSNLDLIDYQFLFYEMFDNDLRSEFYSTFKLIHSTIFKKRSWAYNTFQIEKQNLDYYMKLLGIKHDHHNAMSDANSCYEIFKYQTEILGGIDARLSYGTNP